MKTGLVHIYTGDGKGKTTASMGLALRALGCGLTVRIYQFCKTSPSGELDALKKLSNGIVSRAEPGCSKFVWDMNDEEKACWREAQQTLFDEACETACSPHVDVVILDEIMGAIHQGAIDSAQVKYLMGHKYRGTELILTGRYAPAELFESADYVTEMQPVKHPHDRGVFARRGIEY